MTPRSFIDDVAHVNSAKYLSSKNNLRLAINAVITLDASIDALFRYLTEQKDASATRFSDVDGYKASIAAHNPAYRVVRDLAVALKSGSLGTDSVRLVRSTGEADTSSAFVGKLLANRSNLNTRHIAIEVDGEVQRADDVILDVDMLLTSMALRHQL